MKEIPFDSIIKDINENQFYKLGTIASDVVETTPVEWKGELLRFEWYRNFNYKTKDSGIENGWFRFVNMNNGDISVPFAHGRSFGSAFCENDIMYVVATSGWGKTCLELFTSGDLVNWKSETIVEMSDEWSLFNTSLCRGKDEYIMAIEIGSPSEITGVPFTTIFAHSHDLHRWILFDTSKYVFTKDRYSACPTIRYIDGYYYLIYLERIPCYKFVPYIARSKDLENWEIAEKNPIMFYSDEDKKYASEFSDDEKQYILDSVNTNNSDVDLCEYKGKTIITYSWGNQRGREFLALAMYNGKIKDYLQSFFC